MAWNNLTLDLLSSITESLRCWKSEKRTAIWLQMPIEYGHYIEVASRQGFDFHNAEGGQCLLKLWLKDGSDNTPRFATHQLGVCGKHCFFFIRSLILFSMKFSHYRYLHTTIAQLNLRRDMRKTCGICVPG